MKGDKADVQRQIEALRQHRIDRWIAGDGEAGIEILEKILMHDQPGVPDEAMRLLRVALMRWTLGDVTSLDDAFGLDSSNSARVQRRLDQYAGGIYVAVNKERERLKTIKGGERDPFVRVAERSSLKRKEIKNMYYAYRDFLIEREKA